MIRRPRTPMQIALLVLAALALLYAGLLHPLLVAPWREVEDEIGTLQERKARIDAQLAQAPLLATRMQALERELLDRPGLMPETSEGLAVAGLVRRLEVAVEQANPGGRSCLLNEHSPLPAVVDGRHARVALRARLRCGTAELAQVLDQLENDSPRLFVEELEIQAQRHAAAPGESGQGLDVSLHLLGFMPATAMQATPEAAP